MYSDWLIKVFCCYFSRSASAVRIQFCAHSTTVRGTVSEPDLPSTGSTADLSTLKPESFLQNETDVRDLRLHPCVLVGPVLCDYIKCLINVKEI